MPTALYTLQNDHWQVGILPETGGSIAFGRIRIGETYRNVMRPTAEADYSNASLCASFIMLPWANRLRDARFRFRGKDYPLQPSSSDGTAIHGVVRKLPWRVVSADEEHVRLIFDSALHEGLNFPFEFSAEAQFQLQGEDFVLRLRLTNEDQQPMPAGFGHHPYFLIAPESPANRVQLEIPYDLQYTLHNALPDAPPHAVAPQSDYRLLKPLDEASHDDLFSGRQSERVMRLHYPQWAIDLQFLSDPIFEHVLLFAPPEKPFFALEPQTNANDGFNLAEKGIAPAGVFVLDGGQSMEAACTLRLVRQ
jgi:aldose 1-epimerase